MKNKTFPALRCKMGEWVYYLTFFKFSDIDKWIQKTDQIHKSDQLRDMIQRALTDNASSIKEYLIKQEERFFNSIVVGVYGGAPQWYPIEVSNSPVLGEPELDENERNSIGVLAFDGSEELFAIDGQHRVEGIKLAIAQDSDLNGDEISVILLAHEKSTEGQKRTRRLFTTLNKHAKPVSPADIIALDEDDAFAITTRRLVEEFSLLKSKNRTSTRFIHYGHQASLNKNDDTNLTTIRTIYKMSSSIYLPNRNAPLYRKRRSQINDLDIRPSQEVLDEIYKENITYWNCLKDCFPEYQRLFNSSPEDAVAGEFRNSGGHLMFRPLGQLAFASSVRVILDRGYSINDAVNILAEIPMDLNQKPWVNIVWDPTKQRVIRNFGSRNIEGIMLYMIGQEPRTPINKILARYRKYVDDEDASLPKPVSGTLV